MRVLIVHNRYQQRGGEDVVVELERDLLSAAGHHVACEIVSNDSIRGLPGKAAAFVKTPFNSSRMVWIQERARAFRPDVVHIHNFFPLLSPAVHIGAAKTGAAVVQTLHNYRLLCAGAMFLRDGAVCEKCLGGSRLWGAAHGCYRGSKLGSLAVVGMQDRTRSPEWLGAINRFIALTEFSKSKFVAGGFPEDKLAVRPNTVLALPAGRGPRSGALFVGRISKEKGVATLIEAFAQLPDIPLTIIGDGPQRAELERIAPANVTFAGAQSKDTVATVMRSAAVLIMPSVWYEGFPVTLLEAYAAGLPVLASNIGSLSEVVRPGETGNLFAAGDAASLTDCVRRAFADPAYLSAMGANARRSFNALYAPEASMKQLEQIYADAIATKRASS